MARSGPAELGVPVNISAWIEEARPTLKPPVGNRMMYNGRQFQVMIIGGPNQRDDFHVEAGEELFFQIEGDMVLDVMQEGKRVGLPIKEKEIFILPVMVPHSPQRFENTIGLVIERVRRPSERDTLRWYKKGTNKIEYQEVFYCSDLGTQIKECILRYFGMKDRGVIEGEFGFGDAEPTIHTAHPSPLSHALKNAKSGEVTKTSYDESEFSYYVLKGVTDEVLPGIVGGDAFLWQLEGISTIEGIDKSDGGKSAMKQGEVMLLPIDAEASFKVTSGDPESVLLLVVNSEVVA